MAKGGGNSDDWAGCEQCSYCFTIFVGILFFLAGGAMAVYGALFLFAPDLGLSLDALDALNTDAMQWGVFIIGLCIAFTALLGMVMAGCARCAANPDGKNDCCEQCCTAILGILYIIILSVLVAATLVIAGGLSYYAVKLGGGSGDNCPYTSASQHFTASANNSNSPDALECPIDLAIYEAFYPGGQDPDFSSDTYKTAAASWKAVQDSSVTCGYWCDSDTCNGLAVASEFAVQITGTYCTYPVNVSQSDTTQYTDGNAFVSGAVTQQAYRPTLYSVLNTYLIPLLVVWWCIFVLAVLLIVAACAMCVRKSKTSKETKYKPTK